MASPGLSKEQKQLLVLVLAAVWIIIALFLAFEEAESIRFGFRTETFVIQSIVWCSPALLFGGIFLWWFRKK